MNRPILHACNTCAFTVNLSTNSLIHHFRYNSRPSENRFSDGLLPAQEGKTDETDDRINNRRCIFSPQPECLRRFGEKQDPRTNRSKISVKPPSQTGIPPQNQNQRRAGAVEIYGRYDYPLYGEELFVYHQSL